MRYLILATLILTFGATESPAQYRLYSRSYAVTPLPYYGPPAYGYTAYASPYGYRTYSAYQAYPGVLYQTSGAIVRPFVSAPLHSIYWDPFANTYRYAPGYLNAARYSYAYSSYPYYGYGYPYPNTVLPYATSNPYLPANPVYPY